MGNKFKRPVYMLMFGMFVLILGGFFAVIQVGMSERKADNAMAYGFGSRNAEPAEKPGYAEAFSRGGAIIADKAGDFVSSILPGGRAAAPAAAPYAAAARRGDGGSGEGEKDPFEDFYARNYGSGTRGSGSNYAPAGGTSFWSGSGSPMTSGGSGSSAGEEAGGGAPASADGEEKSGEAPAGAAPGNPLFGGPLGKGDGAPAQPLQASVPQVGKGAQGAQPFTGVERPGEMAGGQVAKPQAGQAGGKVSGMSGSGAAADLNGADEKASASSSGSYGAKMSGGAAATASAGAAAGGGVPEASKAAEVSADGSASGGEGGDKAAAGEGKKADGEKKAPAKTSRKKAARTPAAPPAPPFLKTVAAEKLSGTDAGYFTEEDTAGELDKSLLASGAIPGAPVEKAFALPRSTVAPDPAQLSNLPAARQAELKKELYVFLAQVEREYGEIRDAFYSSCGFARELCSEHGLTEGYLTLKTHKGAKLLLGLKYVEKRWSPYTLGFVLPEPAAPVPAAAPEEPSGDEPAEEDPAGEQPAEEVPEGSEGDASGPEEG